MNPLISKYNNAVDSLASKFVDDFKGGVPSWNKQEYNKKDSQLKYNYVDCFMLLSLYEYGKQSSQAKFMDFCDEFLSQLINEDGVIDGYNQEDFLTDDVLGGRVMLELLRFKSDKKYKIAAKSLYEHMAKQPKNSDGCFWHAKNQPNQIFLDSFFMTRPFLAMYKSYFEPEANYDDIVEGCLAIQKTMFDHKSKLYYHAYDASKKASWANKDGLSASFWLRGMGWLAMALVDTIYIMPDGMAKISLKKQLMELLDGVLQYRDGAFYQVVDKAGAEKNYFETSGSCMIAYACIKANFIGEDRFVRAGIDILKTICDNHLDTTDDKLVLKDICLVADFVEHADTTTVFGSYEYYVSQPVVSDDAKGIAPFLMAWAQLVKYDNQV